MPQRFSPLLWLLACAASFALGRWWLPATPSSASPAATTVKMTPGSPSAPPSPKSPAAGAATWADRVSSELEEIRRAAKPGQANPVLLAKLRATLSIAEESKRLPHWNALMTAMRTDDATAVLALFREMDQDGRWYMQEGATFWHQWAEVDGPAAASMASREHPSSELYARLMRGWASQDSTAAAAWLAEHGEADGWPMREAAAGLVNGIGDSDPDAAEKFLRTHADEPLYQAMVHRLAWYQVYGRGIDAATAWFQRLAGDPGTPPSFLHDNLGSLASILAERTSGDRTPQAITPYFDQPWFPTEAAQAVGRYYGENKPEEGVETAGTLASEEKRIGFLQTLGDRWAKKDPAAMERWLASNPDHASYDSLALPLINRLARTDAAAAQRLADSLKSDDFRRAMTQQLEQAAKRKSR